MNKVSWVVALLVGVVIGVTVDRMAGGAGTARRPARPSPVAPLAAPPVEDPRAVYRVPVDDTPLRGPADALVTIVVASDFQCPFCKRVEPTLQAVQDAFPGKVRIGWKHQPLAFHPQAMPSAILAEEARAQGGDAKFWAMHDKLFEIAPALDRPQLEAAAQQLGLDVAKVREALDRGKHADRIRRDQALCTSLGANGTPTLFVNGRKVVGAVPLEQLKSVVQEELRKAEALVARGVAPKDVYAKALENGATATVYLPGTAPRPGAPAAAAPTPPREVPIGSTAARVPLRKDDPVRGPADAKVTIAVFSDFQCPFCARVEPTLRELERAFPGAVRIAWKHLPLPPGMHPQARPAAEAAEAARAQGKFWPMHDRLFENQRSLSPEQYESAASAIGLDLAAFKRAVAAHAGAARIEEDLKLAAGVGASATPTLFVNCRRIEGAYPFDRIKPIVEEEIRNAEALLRAGKPAAQLYDATCGENVRRLGGSAAAVPVPAAAPAALPGGASAVPVRADDPAKGRTGAPLTVVVFSDFQCPFCAQANPKVREIEAAYPNDVRIVWKHLPLPMHANAVPAALAAEAARAQGGGVKFWAMHDRLFANQSALSETSYERYAKELGLDVGRFRKDMADPSLRARVEDDTRLAERLGINGTPTFVVNGERVVGADGLRPTVDRLVALAHRPK